MKIKLKQKIFMLAVVIFVVTLNIIAIFLEDVLTEKHHIEIEKVINSRGGVVIEIENFSKNGEEEIAPLKSSRSNVIYKVIYEKNGNQYIAWYRGTRTVNNIHSHSHGSFPEEWIFNE